MLINISLIFNKIIIRIHPKNYVFLQLNPKYIERIYQMSSENFFNGFYTTQKSLFAKMKK